MQMQEVAQKLGLQFDVNDEYGLIAMMKDFELFKKGYGKRITNIMSVKRDIEQADIRVFDYKFVVGAGNSTRTVMQTVFYVHSKELNLPQLLIYPERFYHRVGEWMDMQDIDFEMFPIFSKQYLVQGPEEDLVRNALNEEVLNYFTHEKNWYLEGINYLLVFYKRSKRIPADQIEDFYEKGMKVFEMFKNNDSRT
jgi:hypothetical protein